MESAITPMSAAPDCTNWAACEIFSPKTSFFFASTRTENSSNAVHEGRTGHRLSTLLEPPRIIEIGRKKHVKGRPTDDLRVEISRRAQRQANFVCGVVLEFLDDLLQGEIEIGCRRHADFFSAEGKGHKKTHQT